jgi:hypothetical protein
MTRLGDLRIDNAWPETWAAATKGARRMNKTAEQLRQEWFDATKATNQLYEKLVASGLSRVQAAQSKPYRAALKAQDDALEKLAQAPRPHEQKKADE